MQPQKRLLVAAACALLFLFQLSLAQKSYRISNIETDIYVPEAGCVVSVKEKYTVTFSGGSYSKLGIPIRRDSVYTIASNPATMVTGLQASLPVSSSMVVAADANDKETAYMIVLNFEPSTGSVTFQFEYNINGFLHTNGNQNQVMYSTKWNDAWIDAVTTRIHFPASFNLNLDDITMNPSYYGTKTNNTVEYKMSSISPSVLYLTQTSIPLKTDICKPPPVNPLAYILPVIGAVLFLCVCIPVCVCLGCLSNARRRMFGGGNGYYTTSTYSTPGYGNNYYGDNYYHHNHHSGFGHHHSHHGHHHHHHHHSSGHSSSGHSKVAGTSGGSGFAA